MSWLNYEEFSALQTKFDERVRRACEIDRFCSSTDWIEPARPFMPYAEPYIWHTENAFCVFACPFIDGTLVCDPMGIGVAFLVSIGGGKPSDGGRGARCGAVTDEQAD